jgi:hypothetical protein
VSELPRNVLADAGPLAALFRKNDKHHRATVDFAARFSGTLYSTWPAVTEAAYLLNNPGNRSLVEFIRTGGLTIFDLRPREVDRVAEILSKYPRADLADATLVAAAEALGTTAVITIDRTDFDIYRTKSGRRFENLL